MENNYDFTETKVFFDTTANPKELLSEIRCAISEYAKLALLADDGCGTDHANNIITLDNICVMLNSIKITEQ